MHGATIKFDFFRYSYKSYIINPFERATTAAQGEYQYKARNEPTSLPEDLANFKLRGHGNSHYYYCFTIIIIIIICYYSYQTVLPACHSKHLSDIASQRSTERSELVLSAFRFTEVPGSTFSLLRV